MPTTTDTFNFGNVGINATSRKDYSVAAGSVAITLTSIHTEDANSPFSVVTNLTLPHTIPANQAELIALEFAPFDIITYTDVLHIEYTDINGASDLQVTLIGNGVEVGDTTAANVFPYVPSMGVKHTLTREFLQNTYADGYLDINTAEVGINRADGTGLLSTYKGLNVFNIGFNRTQKGVDQLADNLWKFFLARLDALNQPFYFYNPTEQTPPDYTGESRIGRYWVRLRDPNQVLSREYFKYCLYSYAFELIEDKSPISDGAGGGVTLTGPCIPPAAIAAGFSDGLVFDANMQIIHPRESVYGLVCPYHVELVNVGGFRSATYDVHAGPGQFSNGTGFGFPNSAPLTHLAPTTGLTIAFWFYHYGGDIHAQTILSFGNSGWLSTIGKWGNGYSIYPNCYFWSVSSYVFKVDVSESQCNTVTFNLAYGDSGLASDSNSYPALGKWHQLILTYDAASGKCTAYVDGKSRGTRGTLIPGEIYYGIEGIPTTISLANGPGFVAQACNALIPCVRIWDRAFTDEEADDFYRPLR